MKYYENLKFIGDFFMTTLELINQIEAYALKIWKKFTPYQIQQKLLETWDNIKSETGIEFKPLFTLESEQSKVTCAILGSGGFSTGREELHKVTQLKNKLDGSPVEYKAVISNRNKSNAQKGLTKALNEPIKSNEVHKLSI